ncbi:MAG: excisionase family DNA-binding protein [Oscillibacter sp.]|nr:excisionase family DNA-binding protein [Oscillibacter sp.]
MALEQYPELLTVSELCEVLNIGYIAAYRLLNEQVIPAFRIGRNWKIPKDAVLCYIGQWNRANPCGTVPLSNFPQK